MVKKNYTVTNMNKDIAKRLSTWKYPDEYSIYDLPSYENMINNNVPIIRDENKNNYLCFWNEYNELTAYMSIIKKDEDIIFVGIGLAPCFCNKGFGKDILKQGIENILERYPHAAIKLQVRSWNARAIKCYIKAGFKITDTAIMEDHRGVKSEFIIMTFEL